MAQTDKKKDPTRAVTFIIVACVAFVLVALLYKALSGKFEYQSERGALNVSSAQPAAPASEPAGGSMTSTPAAPVSSGVGAAPASSASVSH